MNAEIRNKPLRMRGPGAAGRFPPRTLLFSVAVLVLALALPGKARALGVPGCDMNVRIARVSIEQSINSALYSHGIKATIKPRVVKLRERLFREGLAAYEHRMYRDAERIWHPLAEQGHIHAQFYLGMMYQEGAGVEQNAVEATDWYRKAAEQGHISAQYNIGYLYAVGMGESADMLEAINWWRRAAGNGSVEAQYSLGLVYAQGVGAEKNSMEAVKWWSQAANRGNAAAQFSLGVMYANGEGVARDMQAAEMWWKRSAAQGFDDARFALESLNFSNKLRSLNQ